MKTITTSPRTTPSQLIMEIGTRIQNSGREGIKLQDLYDLTEKYKCSTEQINGIVEAFEEEHHITEYNNQLRWVTIP